MNFNVENKTKIYNVGIYIRLSREDDDKGLESASITNQRSLLLQYIKENNLKLVDIYIDDGYSGTNFDRPDFNRMIQDIETHRINMVITKDMSRLGRDYIGTGNLIEKYFPEKGVRYIAVTDNIDTYLDSSNNDIAPFKAIMNDMYAKDISKKIRSSLKAKQKEGKWVSGRTPFGYMQDPDNKNKLIINEEQAIIVRRIFDMSQEGLSFYKIALILTKEKIKTPAQYYNFEWKNNYNLNYGIWHSKTVRDILTNRMYIGDMIQNKRNKINYKIKRVVKNDPRNYIVVENTQEAIIDKDIFYEVQKRIPKNVGRNEKKETHLLDGFLYCHECGHRISITSRRKKDNKCYTICNYYRTYMKYHVCTTHSNNYDMLENVIIDAVKSKCKSYIDCKKIKDNININELDIDNSVKLKNEIRLVNEELNRIISNIDDIYIDKLNSVIDTNQYNRVKEKLETDINNKEKRLNILNNDLSNSNYSNSNRQEVENYINTFLSMKEPGRELIINLIDRIEISQDKTIDIKFTFANMN